MLLDKKHLWQYLDFNSIKVRLELNYYLIVSQKEYVFQFHKGTIRTMPS